MRQLRGKEKRFETMIATSLKPPDGKDGANDEETAEDAAVMHGGKGKNEWKTRVFTAIFRYGRHGRRPTRRINMRKCD